MNSPHIVSIHILDDDSLLRIFYLHRPFLFGEFKMDFHNLRGGRGRWDQVRWWYRLAHVCQRWRNLTLGAASYLGLSLFCTIGTPVENMLAHSPPLPLTVDYRSEGGIAAEDEEGILLALKQRHRVRHLRLVFPVQNLRKIVMAIDGEFPILEYLVVGSPLKDDTALVLPETLQAPNLCHLFLNNVACPIRSRLHLAAASLVALILTINHQSAYFQPNVLLQWLSYMPQLEVLAIIFLLPVPNREVERQLTHMQIPTHITIPNLRFFGFRGVNAYMDAVVRRVTAPRLEELRIQLLEPRTFSFPCLAEFMDTTEKHRFNDAMIIFKDKEIYVLMFSRDADTRALTVAVDCQCWHLDCQVYVVTQICNALSQAFSAVEHLTLGHEVQSQSSEEHSDVDRIEWRNLLRSFSNVKTLCIVDRLVGELSHCLRLEDGELPLELLPELQELRYFGSRDIRDAFASFIHVRQNAGRPITLFRYSLRPSSQ